MARFPLIVAAAAALSQFGPVAFAQQATETPGFYAGIGTNFAWGYRPLRLNLQRIREMGIRGIRDEALWQHVEPTKGEYVIPPNVQEYIDAASQMDLDLLLVLDYGNKFYDGGSFPTSPEAIEGFCRYSEFVVKSFKGKLKHVEVWNEWDLGLGVPMVNGKLNRGKAEDYVRLLKAVAPRLKAIDPNLVVVGGAVSSAGLRDGWLEQAAKAGLLDACDVVSYHPYVREMHAKGTPEYCYQWMLGFQAMLSKYNGGKPVPTYITEVGWPTGISDMGIPIERQAKYLARTMLLSRAVPDLKGNWWYNLPRSWQIEDPHNTYGLVLPDTTPMPAFNAMAGISDVVTEGKFVGRLETGNPAVYALAFKMPDGSDAWTVWSDSSDGLWQVYLASSAADRKPLTICEAGGVRVTRPWDRKPSGTEAPVTVSDMPWIIRGDLSNVRLDRVVEHEMAESKRPQQPSLYRPETIGQATPISSPADFLQAKIPAEKPANATALDTAAKYVILKSDQPLQGAADLSGWWQLQHDAANLYLTLCVADDQHTAVANPSDLWQGDSVQLAFLPLAPVGEPMVADTSRVTSLEIALTPEGPKLHRSMGPAGKPMGEVKDMPFAVSREGNVTSYRLVVPLAALGGKALKPGDMVAFSLLVNDNDGNGRKGYVEWGGGIGRSKDPLRYNWIVLQ